ncbi:MAG: glucokinase [Bacteroidetes bacterium]|nr:glucokinase [Bacteroidota bacterium]MBS1973768.1 glucokinase [Bacteroidota bacterium]
MTGRWEIAFGTTNKKEYSEGKLTVLAGDVGGTKTNLAVFELAEGKLEKRAETTYHSAQFISLTDIIKRFLAENNLQKPDRICAGVAGPTIRGVAKITNLSWSIDSKNIQQETGVEKVHLLNDLEATAYGLAGLTENDFILLNEGDAEAKGNIAIIAPGTGLGEAGLYWDGAAYYPFPTEGGHCDFCPRTDQDIELFRYLQKKYGVVSWEKVVAGPGIHDIYSFLRISGKTDEPSWLSDALRKDDPSAVISHAAVNNTDAVCSETMGLFVRYLARESSNLVLKMKATGGLFLGGGIPPKIATLLQKESFYASYLDCDRMQHLLKQAPIRIIKNENTALIGAAWYGAFGEL